MQIILLDPRFSARPVCLTRRHLVLLALLFFASVLLLASLLYYLTFRYAASLDIPVMRHIVAQATQDELAGKEKYVRENLAAMATRVGEMQAQIMRLDALGERVQGLAGVKPQEFNFREMPGRGGAEPSITRSRTPTISEFQATIEATARSMELRADYLHVLESALMEQKIRSRLLPTIQPVDVSYNSSGYGWRIDPFTGRNSFHEGVDFAAAVGTPVVATAGGVIIAAEYHHQFGNMVEIDHGNDITTRYAHASRLHVKLGDIVKRGQRIADIGSTGRSTGSHLHFEVLVKGVHQNPHAFLSAGANQGRAEALAGR